MSNKSELFESENIRRVVAVGSHEASKFVATALAAGDDCASVNDWLGFLLLVDAEFRRSLNAAETTSAFEWGRLVYATLEKLSESYPQAGFGERLLRFAVRMRHHFGAQADELFMPHDPYLWFDSHRELEFDEARRMAAGGIKNSIPVLRKLRRIKLVLSILREYAEFVAPPDRIAKWLELREELP